MNGRYDPLSPVSQNGGGEWSGPRYQQPMDINNINNINNSNLGGRGQFISPPNSGGSDGRMNMNMNTFPRNPNPGNYGPSPPPSVARSSNGYARSETDPVRTNSSNTRDPERLEAILGQHYLLLNAFLREGNRDPRTGQGPNKAQDKLLRLSGTQFLELSTDVYDELVRRQAFERRGAPGSAPGDDTPPFLQPEPTFYPKRNQARQKLASLAAPRFRELASDIFCELERRFPRFAAGDIPRAASRSSARTGRSQTPSSNGMRSASTRRKMSDSSSLRGPPPLDSSGMPASPSLSSSEFGGRPGAPSSGTFKPFTSNMIVPNKSTMVEEDDGDSTAPATTNLDDSFAARDLTRGGDGTAKPSLVTARNGWGGNGSEVRCRVVPVIS